MNKKRMIFTACTVFGGIFCLVMVTALTLRIGWFPLPPKSVLGSTASAPTFDAPGNAPTLDSKKHLKIKILILGDSLTEGYGVAKKDAYPTLLEAHLQKRTQKILNSRQKQNRGQNQNKNQWQNPISGSVPSPILGQSQRKVSIQVINAGISGSTTASAISRLKWYVAAKPQILLLALGSNDGLRSFDTAVTQKNLHKTIELAKIYKMEVVLAGMKLPYNYGKEYRQKFENIFKNLVQKHQIGFIPFLLESVGTVKKLNLPDGIHPNEKGHKIIAQTAFKYLMPYVEKLL